ncbi:DUF167 domain-containing protein [Planctomicrobium piriforme]|uniref:UPF0235 protein SAMN05421753_10823 n=1 Tax=Planctomicrobium piriforme TaxID=1576369 RepID=A0A1I3HE73_9PLAN|nr:DUF167 domain-containing protein [Planctomicrobium piriforme]SFI33952.1 hypothetical protein SAMN05421753_10823 [Planctomicrobium piriforme]
MNIELRVVPDGIVMAIQAQPGARRNAIAGVHDGRLKVAVTQVAEKGKANQQILKLLTEELGISKSSVSVVSGDTSSKKSILVTGLPLPELELRLQQLLA